MSLDNLANAATILGLFVGGAGIMKMSGFRVGPVRAITLGLKSRFFSEAVDATSLRTTEINVLRGLLSKAVDKASYVVVQGPKGVGKSCMINTCLVKTWGVVRLSVAPNTPQDTVLNKCYNEIIGEPSFNFVPQKPNVARVLAWYRFFFRGDHPTLVLSMSERPPATKPAEVTGAVRELASMGVKVVVDASPNSLPPELLTTTRQLIMYLDSLSSEDIRALPQLKQMFMTLDGANLSTLVLDMLGGIPSVFIQLSYSLTLSPTSDPYEVVSQFLCGKVNDALAQCRLMSTIEPKFKKIFALFKDGVSHVKAEELEKEGLKLPSPCKVLRQRDELHLEPADPVVSFVFRHECKAEEAVHAMDKLVREAKR